ncbi:MAG: hypothetical protein H6712_23670 [Myxococcales bacterium]|nr:hypothetical protein [Myxococcales bacterium]MCB9716877.1 hypothetical protein [Myxococcales bacterium]
MELLHDSIRGIHMLHWLTAAVPLATLVVVSGMVPSRRAAHLLLLGVAATMATAVLGSAAPELAQLRYGAPLPMAQVGVDPLTGELRGSITVLRACFVANLLFWCSGTVLAGAFIRGLARRIAWIRAGSTA